MAHDVFISYAVEDRQVAEQVCAALEEQSIKCWMAPRDVPVGADYEEAIVDAIAASPLLVLILSAHSNASPHVKREIQNACAEGSTTEVIPLRIDAVAYSKALRYYLGSAQWLDASTPPLEAHLRRLVEHARAHLRKDIPGHPTEVVRTPFKEARRPIPLMWLAAGAGALLLAVVVAFVATRSRGGGSATNNSFNSNLATPAVNSDADQDASPTPPPGTPTPTPRPLRTPIRVFPNLNVRRPLNRNN